MRFIKATTTDNQTELFNLDLILKMQPGPGYTNILLAPGVWRDVYTDTIKLIECYNDLIKALNNGGK